MVASLGCDSIIITQLTINSATFSSLAVSACDDYQSPAGNLYLTSGNYTDTIMNLSGCDSIISINLTIEKSALQSVQATACDSYLSPSGNLYTQSGTYTDTLVSALGCDSVIQTNLVINVGNSSNMQIIACHSFTSSTGKLYTSSGNYTDTLKNTFGCDSLINIALTIISVDTSITMTGIILTSNQVGATYQWLDCNSAMSPILGEVNQSFTPIVNGVYAVVVSKSNCKDTSSCYLISTIGIIRESTSQSIRLFPNPSAGDYTIDLGRVCKDVFISVFDSKGSLISKTAYQDGKTFIVRIDEAAGFYNITINCSQFHEAFNVVKRD